MDSSLRSSPFGRAVRVCRETASRSVRTRGTELPYTCFDSAHPVPRPPGANATASASKSTILSICPSKRLRSPLRARHGLARLRLVDSSLRSSPFGRLTFDLRLARSHTELYLRTRHILSLPSGRQRYRVGVQIRVLQASALTCPAAASRSKIAPGDFVTRSATSPQI